MKKHRVLISKEVIDEYVVEAISEAIAVDMVIDGNCDVIRTINEDWQFESVEKV